LGEDYSGWVLEKGRSTQCIDVWKFPSLITQVNHRFGLAHGYLAIGWLGTLTLGIICKNSLLHRAPSQKYPSTHSNRVFSICNSLNCISLFASTFLQLAVVVDDFIYRPSLSHVCFGSGPWLNIYHSFAGVRIWYGMVWYGMVWYGMVWHGIAMIYV